jgi:hypothetical protein
MFFMVGDVPVTRASICWRTVASFITSLRKSGSTFESGWKTTRKILSQPQRWQTHCGACSSGRVHSCSGCPQHLLDLVYVTPNPNCRGWNW